ncbi:MAG: YMGG-like glycine zipper-containing protein [Gammaproteobacteria bacterium]
MKQVLTAMLIAFLVAGCATPGQQATTEGTAGGAGIGALIGAAVGAAVGGGEGAAIGAGAGALLGGVAGYSYAQNVQSRRNALAGRENDLDAQLRFAEGVNQDTQEANRRLAQEIRNSEDKVNALAARTQQHQATQRELESQRQELSKKVKAAEDQHALAAQQLDDLKQFRSRHPQDSPELDAQIAKLETTLQEVKTNTTKLASLSQRI